MSQIKNRFLAQMPTLTIKGNNTGSTANPLDLTVAQVNAILPVFTSALNGLAPISGGGTTNFLRADGTWAAPPGTTTLTSLGIMSGRNTLASGISTKAITFSTAFGSATGYSITGTIMNLTDSNPQYIPVTVTSQSTTGATFSWNTNLPTANYLLSWQAILLN